MPQEFKDSKMPYQDDDNYEVVDVALQEPHLRIFLHR